MTQHALPLECTDRGARFNVGRTHRYLLWRTWNATPPAPPALFIMLNPSVAGALLDDPTVRSCIRIARARGHGGIRIVNLFAFVTAYPAQLFVEPDAAGDPENARVIASEIAAARLAIVAWGSGGGTVARRRAIENRLAILGDDLFFQGRDLWCLGTNRDGSPKHPLYVPTKAAHELTRWSFS